MTGAPDTAAPGGGAVLAAGIGLALVLGSIHAFSVFLEPLETRFGVSRAAASATYSLALAALTLAVLVGHRFYTRISAGAFATTVLLLAAAGALMAAFAPAMWLVWLGYGIVFGGANGFGYGFALQAAAQANPGRSGAAMGLVTAGYALGAFLSPPLFDAGIAAAGVQGGMLALAAALVAAVPVVAWLLRRSSFVIQVDTPDAGGAPPASRRLTAVLWCGYGAGVAAGLMAIGHATGIARAAGNDGALVLAAPMAIAIANMGGAYAGGRLIDRTAARPVLMVLPVLSAVMLFVLAWLGSGAGALVALAVVGFCYGAMIAAYPAAIAALCGPVAGIRVYGRVFTAWGLAGLLAPWFAGVMYDGTGAYGWPLSVAGALGICSALVICLMPVRNPARSSIT